MLPCHCLTVYFNLLRIEYVSSYESKYIIQEPVRISRIDPHGSRLVFDGLPYIPGIVVNEQSRCLRYLDPRPRRLPKQLLDGRGHVLLLAQLHPVPLVPPRHVVPAYRYRLGKAGEGELEDLPYQARLSREGHDGYVDVNVRSGGEEVQEDRPKVLDEVGGRFLPPPACVHVNHRLVEVDREEVDADRGEVGGGRPAPLAEAVAGLPGASGHLRDTQVDGDVERL